MDKAEKLFFEGTHRCRAPEDTLARVKPFLPQMGITRIANVTGLDRSGIPVVNVIRPNSRSLSVSQGKGLTLAAAKASGVMEAIESFHAERLNLPLIAGSYNDLAKSHPLADVYKLPRLSNTRFEANRPILWIEGTNLFDETPRWLPYETVHTNYTLPVITNAGCLVASTNGLASGNHRLEAIAHGIAEVIERDANTLWAQLSPAQTAQTRVDLKTIDDHACNSIINQLHDAGLKPAVWDITGDLGVASFYCLVVDERIGDGHSGAGAGTHPSAAVALLRALTEAVQVRTNYITGARDDLEAYEYGQAGRAEKRRYAQALMEAVPDTRVDFRSISSRVFDSFAEDVAWMLERLSIAGISEVISVDLTRPEFDIPVVRIVIPGLEGPHDHDDYCPGERAIKTQPHERGQGR